MPEALQARQRCRPKVRFGIKKGLSLSSKTGEFYGQEACLARTNQRFTVYC